MNDLEILSHSYLNPKFVQSRRDAVSLTKAGPNRDALIAEVAELDARLESEREIKARRSTLLAAAGAIPSKYGPGYVAKALNGWAKITAEQIVAIAASKGA